MMRAKVPYVESMIYIADYTKPLGFWFHLRDAIGWEIVSLLLIVLPKGSKLGAVILGAIMANGVELTDSNWKPKQ